MDKKTSSTKPSPKQKTKSIPQLNEKTEEKTLTDEYVEQMDDIHKVAYFIAKEHLGSSFDLSKSIGFKNWNKSE